MADIPYQYNSIDAQAEGVYKDRGSKFFGYVTPVSSIEEIESTLVEISKLHPKSRHVCYAYRLGIDGEPHRINDDGEPSGTAGRPIFNELLSAELSNTLGIVVRYFGGTKLGVPGLIKAYKTATQEAIANASIKKITLSKAVQITYSIEDMGRIYEIIKAHDYTIIKTEYTPFPFLIIDVPLSDLEHIRSSIIADYFNYGIEDINEDFQTDRIEVKILE